MELVVPHSLDAERALLGAILVDPALYGLVPDITPGDFLRVGHGLVWRAYGALRDSGQAIDPLTLRNELERSGGLSEAGGMVYLSSLIDGMSRQTNVESYARIVKEKALRRRLIEQATAISRDAYEDSEDLDTVIERAESRILNLGRAASRGDFVSPSDLAKQLTQIIADAVANPRDITGIRTGLWSLDRLTRGFQPGDFVIVAARPSVGKALALDTKIATPTGWTTMGEIRVGDYVFDADGHPTRVEYVSPVFIGDVCYRVTFSDGSSIVADRDHRWLAYDHAAWKSLRSRNNFRARGRACPDDHYNSRFRNDQSYRWKHPRVVTTGDMVREGVEAEGGTRLNWHVQMAQPLKLQHKTLAVPPYILGCWLGDGTTRSARMTCGDQDAPHFITEFESAGYRLAKQKTKYMYSTSPVAGVGNWRGYRGTLRHLAKELISLGLLRGREKHIPEAYLRASGPQRLALLQGLMDTDGTISKESGRVEIILMSQSLIAQVRELVSSLGERPGPIREKRVRLNDGRTLIAYRLGWTPHHQTFRLARKLERQSLSKLTKNRAREVVSIEHVPSVAVRCISVASESHLFLASESMIPTHNTALALQIAEHAVELGRAPIVSLEMSKESLGNRIIARRSGVDSFRILTGRISDWEQREVAKALEWYEQSGIWIDDEPGQTCSSVCAKIRREYSRGPIACLMVDYLQLMTSGERTENRTQDVGAISRRMKQVGRDLGVPVIALSQLSRENEREKRPPQLSDLREAGNLEQDADVVILLDQPSEKSVAPELRDLWSMGQLRHLILAKQRNGPRNVTLPLRWDGPTMRFMDIDTKYTERV